MDGWFADRNIAQACGWKRVVLELGGNAAMIVHHDWPDLEGAAQSAVKGGFGYTGQSCISVQRIYVQASIFKPFCDALLRMVENLHVGDPALEETDVGPLIRETEAAGGRVVRLT